MKMSMTYRTKSLKELLEIYVFENGRANKEDAEVTQRLVVNEVYARIKIAFDLLGSCEEGGDVEKIYRQLIEH